MNKMDFYQTPAHPCGYLPDRYSINIFADPNTQLSTATYSWLIDHGFRRNGAHLYRPQCPNCSACVPTRVPVSEFKATRSQQRNLRSNQDLFVQPKPKGFSQEYFDLYKHYLHTRHSDSPMEQSNIDDYREFILGTWSDTEFLEFRLGKKLISVAVFDVLPQGLSAVYSFYDLEYMKRGLGTLAILKLIEETRQRKLPYIYLGYWIKESKKMNYKTNFKPIEGYKNKIWQPLQAHGFNSLR